MKRLATLPGLAVLALAADHKQQGGGTATVEKPTEKPTEAEKTPYADLMKANADKTAGLVKIIAKTVETGKDAGVWILQSSEEAMSTEEFRAYQRGMLDLFGEGKLTKVGNDYYTIWRKPRKETGGTGLSMLERRENSFAIMDHVRNLLSPDNEESKKVLDWTANGGGYSARHAFHADKWVYLARTHIESELAKEVKFTDALAGLTFAKLMELGAEAQAKLDTHINKSNASTKAKGQNSKESAAKK